MKILKYSGLIFCLLACFVQVSLAQVPQSFKYQAVARNGNQLLEGDIQVTFSILQGAPDGMAVYTQEENFNLTTEDHGLFTASIGGQNPDAFASIDWGNGPYYLKVELQHETGTVDFPASPILSVPYALYAENAKSSSDWMNLGDTLLITDRKVRINENLNLEEGVFRLWKYFESDVPAMQIYKTSNYTYPNQTAFEVIGGVIDEQPKKFRIFTGNDDPYTLNALLDGNLRIEEGTFRLWKYFESDAPAMQIYKTSNYTYPNQTAFEVIGGVIDEQPKKIRIFTSGNDPYSLKGEIEGDFIIQNNLYAGSWNDHFIELQNGRKRIRATANPDGAMIFYTHSYQNGPRWDFKDLKDDDLKLRINGINGDTWSKGKGSFAVVEVRGADIIEKINSEDGLQPGEVVTIDRHQTNYVKRSTKPYDPTVLGVVSGAGGVRHGMELSQDGLLDGNVSFAIAGRVFVKVTGSVEPGDLLTSSSVPGRAMKAKNRRKRDGAVIGKALSYPDEYGLVLMLVIPR